MGIGWGIRDENGLFGVLFNIALTEFGNVTIGGYFWR